METAFKALSRSGLWQVAPTVVRLALLEEASEEGRRAASSMVAPDVGELTRAQLVFHLVDREAAAGETDVPFLAPRPGCVTRAFESLGCRESYRRNGTSLHWAWPRGDDPPSDPEALPSRRVATRRDVDVEVYTMRSAYYLGKIASPEVFSALEGFHAHIVLKVDRPTPETVGAMLADITGALLTHGATSYRHALRLSPVCCTATYRLSERVAPCVDYLLPFLRKDVIFETTSQDTDTDADADIDVANFDLYGVQAPLRPGNAEVFVPIRIENGGVELIRCPEGPEGARVLIRHILRRWVTPSEMHTPTKDRWREMMAVLYAENRWRTHQPNLN
jgi:hypothetical protein